jgi:hypothetical protein
VWECTQLAAIWRCAKGKHRSMVLIARRRTRSREAREGFQRTDSAAKEEKKKTPTLHPTGGLRWATTGGVMLLSCNDERKLALPQIFS